MLKSLLVSFAAAATLSVASAATYTVSLIEPAIVNGQNLKAGDYRVDVKDNSVVIFNGKRPLEVPAKIEDAHEKFDRTQILYSENNGKLTVHEIHLGGTGTKVTLDGDERAGK